MKKSKAWTCEKWGLQKCKSNQPCMIVAPADVKKIRGCPKSLYNKGKWVKMPTTELTV